MLALQYPFRLGITNVTLGRTLSPQCTKRHDHIIMNNAEPSQGEVVTGARDPDGAVRTASPFVGPTTGNQFDKEDIAAGYGDASQFPSAIEFGIIGLPRIAAKSEHHGVFRFTADLGHLTRPRPGDIGSRGSLCSGRRRRAWFGSRGNFLRGSRRILLHGHFLGPSALEIFGCEMLCAKGEDRRRYDRN